VFPCASSYFPERREKNLSNHLLNYGVTALPPLMALVLLLRRKLSVTRDALFFILAAFLWIYLHLAPTLCLVDIDPTLPRTYWLLQLAVFGLFEVPLTWMYLRSVARSGTLAQVSPRLRAGFTFETHILLLGLGTALLALAFVAISAEHVMYFRRVGHEVLAERSLELPLWKLSTYRTYAETSCFLSLGLLMIAFRAPGLSARARRAVWAAFALHSLVYGFYVLINNRVQTALFLLINFLGWCYWNRRQAKDPIFTAKRIIIFVIALAISMQLVTRLRMQLDFQKSIDLSALTADPSEQMLPDGTRVHIDLTPWRWRLNGLDLMAKITAPALSQGFAWGAAWKIPVQLYFLRFTDPARYHEIKRDLRTNAKVYLLERYLGTKRADYFSSLLCDIYGNFFVYGFLPLGLLLGWLMAWITRSFHSPRTWFEAATALYLLPILYYVEKETIGLFLMALKFSTVLVFWLVCPAWGTKPEGAWKARWLRRTLPSR
jgi:hypothetical protein